MCHFECSNCEKAQECKDLRPWDFEEETEEAEKNNLNNLDWLTLP